MKPTVQPHQLVFPSLLLSAICVCTLITFLQFVQCSGDGRCAFADDFDVFYQAATWAASGKERLVYDLAYIHAWLMNAPGADSFHPFLNPPHSLFLLYPLGFFGYGTAFLLWYGIQIFLLYLSLKTQYMKQLFHNLPHYALLVFFLPFVILTVFTGQLGIICAALFIVVISWRQPQPVLAGLALALLSFKPQIAILLPLLLLAEKNWVVLFTAAGGVLIMVALSVMLWGTALWQDYAETLAIYHRILLLAPDFFARDSSVPYMAFLMVGMSAATASILQIILSFAVLTCIWHVFRTASQESQRILALITATFLVLPYGFLYDTVILAVPCALLLDRVTAKTASGLERMALILLAFIPVVALKLEYSHFPYGVISVFIVFVAVFAKVFV